jgi:hypothetical protein
MRNLSCALLLSHGVPMLQMGDEYGHTKNGNNNTYCHDSELNWVNWDEVAADESGFARFTRGLIAFRWVLVWLWVCWQLCCCGGQLVTAAVGARGAVGLHTQHPPTHTPRTQAHAPGAAPHGLRER